ncbi:MAG: hypothetical protein H7138_12235, partial [Myxococcales bacterium]|nr:hypothetical protein [Myxococcales bacterium]
AQQRGGTPAASGAMSEPGSAVEREADRVAMAFAAGMAPGAQAFAVTERASAGTISRKGNTADTNTAAAGATGPTSWKPTLLGQTLDLSAKLAGARDIGGGKKRIDINQTIGPVRVEYATFKASGDKVESGTLAASIDSGAFKGTSGTLTVDAAGAVSGSLTLPVKVPGLLEKQINVTFGGGSVTAKTRLSPTDFSSPDFALKTSDLELTVTLQTGGVQVGLTGSATVAIDNGMAQGQAKLDLALTVGANGVSFNATVSGKIVIAGLAEADTVIRYDGQTVKVEAGATVPVKLPGLEGTADIKYEKGKLSLDSKNLHFTIPQLAPVNFESVHVDQSKLGAKLSLGSPVKVPLPGGASLTLEKSTIEIDGSAVSGDITGTFALNNDGGLAAKVELAYQRGGDLTGAVSISGGAKFTVAGVEVTIDRSSKLDIAKGMGVSGTVAGKVKIPGIPEIGVKVVATQGAPIDLTCDANIDLKKIVPQLGGNVHVTYQRSAGANAFSFDATDIAVYAPPLNGQVIFSSLKAHLQGGQVTGSLTAKAGTVVKVGGTSVTIVGGTVSLLPGKILDGSLTAQSQTGGTTAQATVGWTEGTFDWAAEGDFDLGQITSGTLLGQVHAAAGSNGTGNFVSNGPITFGSPALAGVEITNLSGNKQENRYTATISATNAVNKVLEKVPNVQVDTSVVTATLTYAGGGLKLDTTVDGSARYPKTGEMKLEGNFHLSATEQGFTGKIDKVKLANEYFTSQDGSADLETGAVTLGQASFTVPGVATGQVTTANVNVKTNQFQVEANVDATVPALQGLKFKVVLQNDQVTASLRENAPTIPLGTFATLTVGAGTTVNLTKETGLTAHVAGAVNAQGLGNGTFTIDYENRAVRGNVKVHVEPFAMFEAVDLDMSMNEKREVSTNAPIVLRLAGNYTDTFAAEAEVSVAANKFSVKGKVTEVKNLGKISEAFKDGGGAVIEYSQTERKVKMSTQFAIGGPKYIDQLDPSSRLKLAYDGAVVRIDGVLKPKSYGPVTFTPDSNLTASWTSASKRFTVTGEAHADIAELCKADFTVDAGAGGGQPGVFTLKGHIDATKLSEKVPGVSFSSVTADFSVLIGQPNQPALDFHINAQINGIPAAGITDIQAHIDGRYVSGQGISGELAVTRAKLGEVIADGRVSVARTKFESGSLHLKADFPALTIDGTATVTPGELGGLNTTADLTVKPSGGSALAKFVQSGNVHVDIAKWKLTNAVGQLHLVPPTFLPIENTVVEVGYKPGEGLHATLSTQFNAPMAKNGEKGTFVAGYTQARGLFAHIEFPITVPGFQAANVTGDLDGRGIRAGVTLIPKDATIVKQANIEIGYDLASGFYLQGSITLKPSEQLELVVGVRFDQQRGLQVMGITPNDKATTNEDHEIANFHKDFPTIPLATVGVASLGLRFGMGVAAGYRMPRIKFKNPKLEGGLEALDQGGMPAFTFGGQIAMGAYISLSLSVQVVGEIQLLIASCSAGIGAEIAARLNLELGADVDGRFAPGQGAQLQIDPFVGASLDLIASLIATLHAEVCWFTIVDKKWTLASANFAHIELGTFHPFNPVGLQIGGPGGTKLTNGLTLRDDAFDQIKKGVQEGATRAGDEEANRDARERVSPVLQSFKNAAPQFQELPAGWENGMTAPPVDFQSMFPVSGEQWDYYQDNADTAEQIAPALAMRTPTERLAKAVAITSRRDPGGAGRLILAWRRAQIAAKGVNPDTGVNVIEEREEVQALIEAKYQADLLAAQEKQKKQDADHAAHVARQTADYTKAEATHVEVSQKQQTTHDQTVVKTQAEWTKAQDKKVSAAKNAQQEGAQVQPAKQEKAPPPPKPAAPPLPKPLAKPAPIP